jgi:hypothetical protein
MDDLVLYLKKEFHPIVVELPLVYEDIFVAVDILRQKVNQFIKSNPNARLNFVGHSTGGIVIRLLMKNQWIAAKTDNCIFIAVPNNGTPLADIHQKLPNNLKKIHETVQALTYERIKEYKLIKPKRVNYAGIAGNAKADISSVFFSNENDGVVPVASVFLQEMRDFIVIPYSHFEIHTLSITAKLISRFLKFKKFPLELKEYYNMTTSEKFVKIVENNRIKELCVQFKGNVDFATLGGKVFWDDLAAFNGWKIQQNMFTKHFRILDSNNIRKAFGNINKLENALNYVYGKIAIDEYDDNDNYSNKQPEEEDVFTKLEKLGKLRDQGIITEEEFQAKKQKYMAKI